VTRTSRLVQRATVVSEADVAHLRTFGYVVLRGALDPGPLADELDRALRDGHRSSFTVDGGPGVSGAYVPMMVERTPVSLGLLDRFAADAAELLGRPVLPLRAKGVRYAAGASWHRDSELPIATIGFAAYLEPLHAGNGALRVLPGSHLAAYGDAVAAHLAAAVEPDVDALPGVALDTGPGDVIVFDEHLFHASAGGRDRRQWRVDYVVDPVGVDEEAAARRWIADTYPPDWDGGYDVDLFPTYDAVWLASGRPCLGRLEALGAHAASAAEEAFARTRHS
jgi:hypothetical protein